MGTKGILVYCISNTLKENIKDITGLDGVNKLYYINNGSLYAVVSNVDLDEYSEESIAEKGEDINWLKEKASAFMDIILKINTETDIIPMKFLTIFIDAEHVESIIYDNSEKFDINFKKISGREEMCVKIYCDNKIFKKNSMGEEIERFEKTLAGKPKGSAFFLKKQFETKLDDRIQDKIYKESNDIINRASGFAVESKSNRLLAKEITGISMPMVSNSAFLIDKGNRELLVEEITKASADHSKDGFMIELTGPWPPYSFCD